MQNKIKQIEVSRNKINMVYIYLRNAKQKLNH